MRILIVEDELRLAEALGQIMAEQRYQADVVFDGADGLDYALTGQYDAIVLDVMLPKVDGFEVARRLRCAHVSTPILMLTARDEIPDKIAGLDHGADDYMTKPFDIGELLARVRAALRVNRYGGGSLPGGVFSAQGLTINYERRKVFVDGQEVRLTQTEYNIVAFLSEHAGRVMTYAAIVRAIWGDTDGSNTYILNELGVGYRMIEEDAKPMESAEETK